jgi:CMP-N-acetylneuraminic acid synthetase
MGTKYLGIIPARGGSKRVPGKNTKLLGGVPLISYTIRAAADSTLLDNYFVSTEDPKIRDLALSYGCPVLNRPLSLAQDDSTTGEVAVHAVEAMESDGHRYDAVVILHPTSPFRTAHHIDEAIEQFESNAWNCSLASTELLPKKTHANVYVPREFYWYRDCEIMNAAIYIVKTTRLKETKQHAWADTTYIMDHRSSIDINDELDFRIAEMVIKDSPNEDKRRNHG